MAVDKLQASRFELKYIITEETALLIRDYVASYLELDEYGVGKPNYSYPVHSLYLDSDDLKLYWATINGNKNRFKLRIRFYNNNPETPVFFEIKRRMNNCILKKRGSVRREAVPLLVNGQFPEPSFLVSKETRHMFAVQEFCQHMQQLNAKPKVHISYLREAYVPHDDNSCRLTMDRDIRSDPELNLRLNTKMYHPIQVWGKNIVLELKFTNRFPDWFRDLVHVFNLVQCGAAKYVDGVAFQGEYKLRPSAALVYGFDGNSPNAQGNGNGHAPHPPSRLANVPQPALTPETQTR